MVCAFNSRLPGRVGSRSGNISASSVRLLMSASILFPNGLLDDVLDLRAGVVQVLTGCFLIFVR